MLLNTDVGIHTIGRTLHDKVIGILEKFPILPFTDNSVAPLTPLGEAIKTIESSIL